MNSVDLFGFRHIRVEAQGDVPEKIMASTPFFVS